MSVPAAQELGVRLELGACRLLVEQDVARVVLREDSYHEGNLEDVARAVERANSLDDVRVIVVESEQRAFFLGGGARLLQTMQALPREERIAIVHRGQRNGLALRRSPKLTVAFANGLVAGGGVELALSCDRFVMGPEARFNLFYSKLGVVPDHGALFLLAQRLPWARAAAMVGASETLDAAACVSAGIADLSLASAAPEWRRVLRQDLRLPRSTRAALKMLAWNAQHPAYEKHLLLVAEQMADLLAGDEQKALIQRMSAMQRLQGAL